MRSGGASARPEMVAIRVTPERKSQSFESQQYADHCDHHFAPRGAHERDTAGDVPAYFSQAQLRLQLLELRVMFR
jgi:hypothetical protein